MVPTRELALQVATEAELFGQGIGVRSIAVYGGVGYRVQLDAFKAGAYIIIGTRVGFSTISCVGRYP